MKKRGVLLALGLTGMLALGVVAGSSLEDAFAQQPPAAAGGHGPDGHGPGGYEHGMHHDWSPSKHIEGRIAFLRTELKITPAQAPLFDAFANLMRANAKKMDDKMAKMHAEHEKMRAEHDKGAPMQHVGKNAIDAIQGHITAEQEHIQHATEMLNVLKPLYASFSDDQKKAADELLAAHHGHHHRM